MDDDLSTFVGEQAHARGADPARPAGHENTFAAESGVHGGGGYSGVKKKYANGET